MTATLQEAYRHVAAVLKRRWKVEIVDASSGRSAGEIADEVEHICRGLTAREDAAAPR